MIISFYIQDLLSSVCYKKPKDLVGFLIDQLMRVESVGAESGFFDDSELEIAFSIADLSNSGRITKDQCRRALASIAQSKQQFITVESSNLIPDTVDQPTFITLAKKILKLN